MKDSRNYMGEMQEELSQMYKQVTDKLSITEDPEEKARLMILEERLNRQSGDILVALHGKYILDDVCPIRSKKLCWNCKGYYTKGNRPQECDKSHVKALKCRFYTDKPNEIYYLSEEKRMLGRQ